MTFLSLKNDANVAASKSNNKKMERKKLFLAAVLKVTYENYRIRIQIRIRSVGQRYESADPDPYQNVTDPQHWLRSILRGGLTCSGSFRRTLPSFAR
jgi:hypothetical protein